MTTDDRCPHCHGVLRRTWDGAISCFTCGYVHQPVPAFIRAEVASGTLVKNQPLHRPVGKKRTEC